MQSMDHIVYVVDDDPRMCEALLELLTSLNFRTISFRSASEYLRFDKPDLPACLILDLRLPDANGLDLQNQLSTLQHPPIIFISGFGDIPSSVKAIKKGAIDFLPKPLHRERLLEAVNEALARDVRVRAERGELNQLKHRFSKLTPRESEVLRWVVAGYLNKQAASELGISEVTFQIHRGNIMRKTGAHSLAELVRMASKLEIPLPNKPSHLI
jgi:FixJ family two-component response regulator